MSDFLLDMGLRHYDFDDAQIARIEAAIPKIAYVTKLYKDNKTVINELIDVLEMVSAQMAKQESK